MTTYLIKAELTQALELEVKAKSEQEARKKADRTSLNDWLTVEDLSFEVKSVEES